jgi:hypothetical protein
MDQQKPAEENGPSKLRCYNAGLRKRPGKKRKEKDGLDKDRLAGINKGVIYRESR